MEYLHFIRDIITYGFVIVKDVLLTMNDCAPNEKLNKRKLGRKYVSCYTLVNFHG